MFKKMIMVFLLLFVFLSSYTLANQDSVNERTYLLQFCSSVGGQIEYVLPDKTRVDCLTDDIAFEIDYANNWYEALGQSLHYATLSGKLPGVVLILEQPSDLKYLKRLYVVIRSWSLPVQVYYITQIKN